MNRIRVFVGSSSEALPIARALKSHLEEEFDINVWEKGVFGLSEVTSQELQEETKRADFAVMILTPDDKAVVRQKKQALPRDNVIFELGLFMGAIGLERAIILQSATHPPRLPTDLLGIVTARYDDPKRGWKALTLDDWKRILEPSVEEMRLRFKKLGRSGRKRRPRTYPRRHVFSENSQRFVDFFERWYSQPGVLRLSCNDLQDWLGYPRTERIVSALLNKAGKLHLYLHNPLEDRVARRLKQEGGATTYRQKASTKCSNTLSLREHDGIYYLIIRHKDSKTAKISFIETDSRYDELLISLVIDLLNFGYE